MSLEEPTEELTPLYPNDFGQLPLEARRVFVNLLTGPVIDSKRHTKLWQSLLVHQDLIQSRLSELFLSLVLDRDKGVAFTRQADVGELSVPALLRRINLTFIDSVLALYLRQYIMNAESRGERAVVAEVEIYEQLSLYEKTGNTDKAGFIRRIHAAIENAKKRHILMKIRGSEGRFEISPSLKLLFSAEEVIALQTQYTQLLEESHVST